MPYVNSWDSGLFGADWDSGLLWDMSNPRGDVAPYLDLITSEHNQRPRFMEMVAAALQPLADMQAVMSDLPAEFDLDVAVGAQLDVLGLWIGAYRQIDLPIDNVYFSWTIAGLGWGEAPWRRPGDPITEPVVLDDDDFRTLLRAKVVNNQWDGTIPGAYAVWDTAFAGTGISIRIQDLQNMHMTFTLTGPVTPIAEAMLLGGHLNVRPAGVMVDNI